MNHTLSEIDDNEEADLIKIERRGKRPVKASIVPYSKLKFVIRVQGKNDMCPQIRKQLYSLRLRRLFSGVFLKKENEKYWKFCKK
nr:60S ribosomal protein L7-1 [Tanacetum cinerariifolium]